MGYSQNFAISAAGMDVERLRVEVASMNLANAHTVAEPGARAFVPSRVVARPAQASWAWARPFAARIDHDLSAPRVAVVPNGVEPRQVLEPGHPQADARGFVSQPGVDTTAEMFTIMTAVRAYEANVAAMTAARTMALKALDIGSAS